MRTGATGESYQASDRARHGDDLPVEHGVDQFTKMKDGRTHLAHKAEHAVDLDTGAIVAVTLRAPPLDGRGRASRRRAAGRRGVGAHWTNWSGAAVPDAAGPRPPRLVAIAAGLTRAGRPRRR